MGGQRNSKMLKLVGGAMALLVALYILYGYRQSHSEAQTKSLHLKEAKQEYLALSKRFDMLSNELKGEYLDLSVQFTLGESVSWQ